MIFSRTSLTTAALNRGTVMMRRRPRTCVGCREESPKREMLRIARNAAGEVSVDPSGRLPGRGAYVCLKEECILSARKRDALSKALRVKVDAEVYDTLLRMAAVAEGGEEKGQ
jgi:predicted RNA-binding protein YlxR (DUF448 family)